MIPAAFIGRKWRYQDPTDAIGDFYGVVSPFPTSALRETGEYFAGFDSGGLDWLDFMLKVGLVKVCLSCMAGAAAVDELLHTVQSVNLLTNIIQIVNIPFVHRFKLRYIQCTQGFSVKEATRTQSAL